MKKFYVVICCLFCLVSLTAFAECGKTKTVFENTPLETCQNNPDCNFLCYCIKKCELYKKLGLSETQKCRADKIQSNYEFDSLSIREKIKCEEESLSTLMKKCACESDIKAQKKIIKALKKDLKKTCKCYSDAFEDLLSDSQEKQYEKLIKGKCKKKKCCNECDD